jgi:hypothetical protein
MLASFLARTLQNSRPDAFERFDVYHSSCGIPASTTPRQRDVCLIPTSLVMDPPRSVFRAFDDGPIAMQLDELATVDGPQEAGTAELLEGPGAVAPE